MGFLGIRILLEVSVSWFLYHPFNVSFYLYPFFFFFFFSLGILDFDATFDDCHMYIYVLLGWFSELGFTII